MEHISSEGLKNPTFLEWHLQISLSAGTELFNTQLGEFECPTKLSCASSQSRMGAWSQPKATPECVHVLLGHCSSISSSGTLSWHCLCVSFPSLQPQTAQKGPCSTPQGDNHAWHFTAFHLSLNIWSSFPPAFSVNTAFCSSEIRTCSSF